MGGGGYYCQRREFKINSCLIPMEAFIKHHRHRHYHRRRYASRVINTHHHTHTQGMSSHSLYKLSFLFSHHCRHSTTKKIFSILCCLLLLPVSDSPSLAAFQIYWVFVFPHFFFINILYFLSWYPKKASFANSVLAVLPVSISSNIFLASLPTVVTPGWLRTLAFQGRHTYTGLLFSLLLFQKVSSGSSDAHTTL